MTLKVIGVLIFHNVGTWYHPLVLAGQHKDAQMACV